MALTEEKREKNKKRFCELILGTNREGAESLLSYLETTDFYDAPARTEHGCAYPGGLLAHSLHVYALLQQKFKAEHGVWNFVKKNAEENGMEMITQESLIIVSLLHDLCKIGTYTPVMLNKKSYEPETVLAALPSQIKTDTAGKYVWETVQGYRYEEKMPLGKGEKSVILALRHMRLTDDEIYAIRWSRGYTEEKNATGNIGRAFALSPLALALYEADLEATFIVD